MTTENLFSVLASIHPITAAFRVAIEKAVTPLSLPGNHMLLEAGRVAECAYFLDHGFAMAYTFLDAKKQVEGFWTSGQIVLPASFFEQVPSHEFIQLRTDCNLYCISHTTALDLLETYKEARFIYRVGTNRYLEQARDRIRDLQNMTAFQRYEKLIAVHPRIEQHVTQEDIASYLGIAPPSFSRLKRQARG